MNCNGTRSLRMGLQPALHHGRCWGTSWRQGQVRRLTVRGILVPAKAMSRVQLPPIYANSPEVVSSVLWKGGCPSTSTCSFPTMCFPARIFSRVVLPAPLAPTSRHLLPGASFRHMSVIKGGLPGIGRPSVTQPEQQRPADWGQHRAPKACKPSQTRCSTAVVVES
jgi:hypothetical protein